MLNHTDGGTDVANIQEVRSAREMLDTILEDVQAGGEPEWEEVAVPAWKGRKVWVRGLTLAERTKVRRDGYRPAKNDDGEIYYQETGELEPMLLAMTVYVEIAGRKERLFRDAASRQVLKRQRGGALDELVATALRLSGLAGSSAQEAKEDFLSDQTSSSDSDSPETWD